MRDRSWVKLFGILILIGVVLRGLSWFAAEEAEAITLGNYMDRVRYAVVGDTGTTNDLLTDSMIVAWVNEGRFLLSGLVSPIEADTAILTVDQYVRYALPSNFQNLRGVLVLPDTGNEDFSGGISVTDAQGPQTLGDNANSDEGPLEQHFFWGTANPKLFVDPPPLGAYYLTVLFSQTPTTLGARSDVCDLPLPYQPVALMYAKARVPYTTVLQEIL